METDFDRDDARVGGIWSTDVAGANADQLSFAWLPVCSDFRCWLDRRNAFDVGIDRLAVRIQLEKTDSLSSGPANTRRRFQHLLRYLVRIQSILNAAPSSIPGRHCSPRSSHFSLAHPRPQLSERRHRPNHARTRSSSSKEQNDNSTID